MLLVSAINTIALFVDCAMLVKFNTVIITYIVWCNYNYQLVVIYNIRSLTGHSQTK